ncbi:MAG: formate dehydrogenase accessory sulfurtransferase FdhD [Acidimicrobiales bacterium]
MGRGRTTTYLTQVFDTAEGTVSRAPANLAVEEPLEIRLDDHLVATTMRTPGHDFDLAVGWCHAEGLLDGFAVDTVRYCATGSAVDTKFNVVSVSTGGRAPEPVARLGSISSSCGLCGSTAIDDLVDRIAPLASPTTFSSEVLAAVPDRVRDDQDLFSDTGAVHCAAAFDIDGQPVLVREDIGRHNAVDKIVGRLVLEGTVPAAGLGLAVSGRASFEIVQKAWAAGFSTVVAVSAPSALAVEVARRAGITLAGFARGGTLRLYAGSLDGETAG